MQESIGNRLKRLRTAKNFSQKQLAKLCGVAQSTIASIEGESRGYGLSIVAIAQALETTTDYLQGIKALTAPESTTQSPFSSVTASQFSGLDAGLRDEIEDRLLGAIVRQSKNGTNHL